METYGVVVLLVGSLMGVLTSYTDIKTGFIFDNHVFPSLYLIEKLRGKEGEEDTSLPRWLEKLILPATETGFLLYLYLGLRSGNYLLAVSGFLGFLLGLSLGLVLYYAGAWASGDILILAAFSALLPYPLSVAKAVAPYETSYPLYPLAILLNSILAVFPFIFIYALGILIVRRKTEGLKRVFSEGAFLSIEATLWLTVALALTVLLEMRGYSLGGLYKYLITLLLFVIFGKYRRLGDGLGVASLAYLAYLTGIEAIYAFIRLLVIFYTFKLFFSVVKVLREEALVEEVPVEELREWDILGETIYIENGNVKRDRRGFFDVLREAITTGNINALTSHGGKVIASPTAEGLTKEQIERLRELVEEDKLENRFLRKTAMPFAPSIFLGFLISALWGDLFWWLVLRMSGL